MTEDCPAPPPFVLGVGRLHPQKGFDLLLEAFARFARERPDWRLLILGEGEQRVKLEALAARLDIAHRVSMPGHIDPFPCYDQAAFLAFPSRYEGFPNAVLEAMSRGLPAIVNQAQPGSLEIVRHEINGLVTAADNADELAGDMARLADDEELLRTLGRAAREAAQPYEAGVAIETWSRMVSDLLKAN